jgi:hypothetical protein
MSGRDTGYCARTALSILILVAWSSAQVTWTHFTYASTSNLIGSPDVYAIAIDPNDDGETIWVGSRPNDSNGWSGGLASYNRFFSSWELLTTANSGLPHNWVYDMEFDSQGTLWIGTKGGGLAKFIPPYDEFSWTVYDEAAGLGYDQCYEIHIDADDNIWIGHGPPDGAGISAALTVFDGLFNWQTFGTPTLAENAVYGITIDDTGKVWCATKTQGLYILDHGGTPFNTSDDQWEHITSGFYDSNFNANAALNVNGDLWFGHDNGGGVDQWDGSTWTNHFGGAQGDWIRAVAADWRGYVWCGEKRGHDDADGFWIYDGTEWTNYNETHGLGWNVVSRIIINDAEGEVWIGHGNPGDDAAGGGVTLVEGLLPVEGSTALEPPTGLIKSFALGQNYPNPFNAGTAIEYRIERSQNISLVIYDINGRLIRTLANGFRSSGSHSVVWDGTNDIGGLVGSGIYLYQLTTEDVNQSVRKALLLK